MVEKLMSVMLMELDMDQAVRFCCCCCGGRWVAAEDEYSGLFQRPQGAVSSSMLGLEAVNGSLDDFSFEDFHCLNE
ncbi:hypothetical protein C5167_050874 [Papaver somniferum]|uniref:Uncharacterized protein n=1 Tax=Papaver somniferum TaxID=3469 RepID=A0A4Y7KSL8_PAPSO|nr:hypothetical protein C5167_050874 [Papaver somniferum]